MRCDICDGEGPHGLPECRANLLARVKKVQAKHSALTRGAASLRTQTIKDQSGVALSTAFMQERGLGQYSRRETGKTLEQRVTVPITMEHFLVVVSAARCLQCDNGIEVRVNPAGGKFWICTEKECGWYIGWRQTAGRGEQMKVREAEEAA